MRLCYIANPYTIHAQRWLAYFAARGHDVHLIDLRAAERPPAPSIPGVTIHEVIKGPRLPLSRGQGLLYYPAAALRTRRIVQRLQPRLIHAHFIGEWAWVAALSGCRPLVVTAWGGDVLPDQGAFDRPVQRLLTPFAVRAATLLTANAPHLVKELDRHRRPQTPVLVINHGVDRAHFRPGLDTTALRRTLQLGDGPVIFSPRSMLANYKIEAVVRAWPLVIARHPQARLLLSAYDAAPDYERDIRQLAGRLAIEHSLRFLGRIEHNEMPYYYNLATITVSVPTSDGLPVTALETMACGSPPIVSDLPWTEGVIEHGRNGLRVPVGDHEALAAAITQLLEDEQRRCRIIEENFAWVAEHGDLKIEMQKMERAYEEL